MSQNLPKCPQIYQNAPLKKKKSDIPRNFLKSLLFSPKFPKILWFFFFTRSQNLPKFVLFPKKSVKFYVLFLPNHKSYPNLCSFPQNFLKCHVLLPPNHQFYWNLCSFPSNFMFFPLQITKITNISFPFPEFFFSPKSHKLMFKVMSYYLLDWFIQFWATIFLKIPWNFMFFLVKKNMKFQAM